MFLFRLAEQMGQTVEWVLNNVSVLEMKGWAKYFSYIAEKQKQQSRASGGRRKL